MSTTANTNLTPGIPDSPLLALLSDHDAIATTVFSVQHTAWQAVEDGDTRFADPNIVAHAVAEILIKNGFHR